MKKLLLFIYLLTSCAFATAQSFALTPNGFVDAENPNKNYIIVEFKDKSQTELYTSTLMAIGKTFISPKDVISKVESQQITLRGIQSEIVRHSISKWYVDYTICIEFKDNRVKIGVPKINCIYNNVGANMFISRKNKDTSWLLAEPCIFDKKDNLSDKDNAAKLELFANGFITLIKNIEQDSADW